MAKVMIEYDTLDKTVMVSIDGVPVDNVKKVMIGMNYKDDYECCIDSCLEDEDNEVKTITRVVASNGQLVDNKPKNLDDEIKAYFGK